MAALGGFAQPEFQQSDPNQRVRELFRRQVFALRDGIVGREAPVAPTIDPPVIPLPEDLGADPSRDSFINRNAQITEAVGAGSLTPADALELLSQNADQSRSRGQASLDSAAEQLRVDRDDIGIPDDPNDLPRELDPDIEVLEATIRAQTTNLQTAAEAGIEITPEMSRAAFETIRVATERSFERRRQTLRDEYAADQPLRDLESVFGGGADSDPLPADTPAPGEEGGGPRSVEEINVARQQLDIERLQRDIDELRAEGDAGANSVEIAELQQNIADRYSSLLAVNTAADNNARAAASQLSIPDLPNEARAQAGIRDLSARSSGLRSSQAVFDGQNQRVASIQADLNEKVAATADQRNQLNRTLAEAATISAQRQVEIRNDAAIADRREEIDAAIQSNEDNLEVALLNKELADRRLLDSQVEEDPGGKENTYGGTGTHTDEEAAIGFEIFKSLASSQGDGPEAQARRYGALFTYYLTSGIAPPGSEVPPTLFDIENALVADFGDLNEITGERKSNDLTERIMNQVEFLTGYQESTGLFTRTPAFDHLYLTPEQRQSLNSWVPVSIEELELGDNESLITTSGSWVDPVQG